MATGADTGIDSLLKETRLFRPSEAFSKQSHVKSVGEYEKLWNGPRTIPKASGPSRPSRWTGSRSGTRCWSGRSRTPSGSSAASSTPATTASTAIYTTARKNKAAIIWEGEPGDSRVLRYQDLHREVCKFANVLKGLGIKAGDRVTIYMPMIPELAIAMLACARIGATHSIVFGGFSAEAVADRNNDAKASAGHHRRRRLAARQGRAAQAERRCRLGEVADGREVHRLQPLQPAGRDEARPRLLVARADGRRLSRLPAPSRSTASIRSSSSTRAARPGKPKGVLHTTAGYLLGTSYTQVGLRSARGRHLLVHGRHRLGDGAQLHRLRPARQRGDDGDVRRAPRTTRARTASGASSRSTASTSSTPRRPPSGPSSSGATSGRRSTTCRACACWARSASRSIPRRGCGITR